MAQERRASQLAIGIVENLKITVPDAPAVQVLWSDKARRALPSVNIAELVPRFRRGLQCLCERDVQHFSPALASRLMPSRSRSDSRQHRRCLCSV